MDLTDKVVIITGASSGIGAAIAHILAAAGAKLVLTGRNEERLTAVTASVDGSAQAVIADVTQKDDCQRTVAAALDAFGAVDVLINNAGYAPPASLLETDEDLWDVTIDTCLKGVFLMTQAALPTMLDAGGGRIVQVSSVAGINGYGNRTAYCAAKWGVQGFTAALRDEHGEDGIRAHIVNPGAVATPWWGRTNDPQDEEIMERMIQPEQVAEAVLYMLSQPDNIQINDVVIHTNRSPWEGES